MGFIRDRKYFFGGRAQKAYEFLGRRFADVEDWRFMNYGYGFADPTQNITLQPEDEAERYCAQLYHVVASQVDLKGKAVLDVGSGRGGGASYIHRYLGPKSTTGMDLAESAVEFCRKVYEETAGLSYQQGNAMEMPFEDGTFDAVTNVESSHCYPDKAKFFAEVLRVLKPGGNFLYTDFTDANRPGDDLLEKAGFADLNETDVTAEIIRGLEQDEARRREQIRQQVPFGFRKLTGLWAGTTNSWIYRDFVEGRRKYRVFRATKSA